MVDDGIGTSCVSRFLSFFRFLSLFLFLLLSLIFSTSFRIIKGKRDKRVNEQSGIINIANLPIDRGDTKDRPVSARYPKDPIIFFSTLFFAGFSEHRLREPFIIDTATFVSCLERNRRKLEVVRNHDERANTRGTWYDRLLHTTQ